MPIKANNIIVGGQKLPTNLKEKPEPKQAFGIKFYGDFINKSESKKLSPPPEPIKVSKTIVVETPIKVLRTVVEEEPSRYVEKKDGELIRNINTRSHYLRDILEIE